jgi:acyl-coenzyme A thioesterase PaaI-like protein
MKIRDFLEQNNLQELVERYLTSSFVFYDSMGISVLDFIYDKEIDSISTEVIPEELVQGHKDVVHGGIVATYIDTVAGVHAMIHALKNNQVSFTKELTIKYKSPMLTHQKYSIVSSHEDKTFSVVIQRGGVIIAEGKLVFAFK